ncbi:Ammonium transporter, partial [Globisporangium splendens]
MLQLPQEQSFALSLGVFQLVCLIFFAIHFDTITPKSAEASDSPNRANGYYSMYMDVHVMIFVGFGFLMTYLRKYSLSAVSLNFVVGVMALQWGIITVTMAHQVGEKHYPKANIDIPALINGDFAAAAVLISFGAILGKTTPTQLLWMAFFELVFYAINETILMESLEVIDAGGSLVIHTFGAFFGLAVSLQIGAPPSHEQHHNTSRYTSDIFAMIGTLFLWMFWPSFNAAMVPSDGFRQERAIVNTLLSIAASCASTFAATQVLTTVKKFDMVHLQNATLAGGVAMGTACELALNPASAITVGLVAGVVSVTGYRFFTPALERRIRLSDSAGILNLHGMPGVLGGLAGAFATMALSDDNYGNVLTDIYEAREHRSAREQGGYQLLAIVVTLGMALVSGTAVGMLLRSPLLFRQQQQKYEDEEWFHLPGHEDLLPLGSSPPSQREMESTFGTQSPQTSYELMSIKTS